jgi:hypothetical protein
LGPENQLVSLFSPLGASEIRDGIVRRLKVNVSVQKQVGLQWASGFLLFYPGIEHPTIKMFITFVIFWVCHKDEKRTFGISKSFHLPPTSTS